MRTYLYRVLETDYQGHPLAHGVLRATNRKEAVRLAMAVLRGKFEYLDCVLRLYPLDDVKHGIFGNKKGFTEWPIEFGEPEEVVVDIDEYARRHGYPKPFVPEDEDVRRELNEMLAQCEFDPPCWRERAANNR
jgi:hypothetical protein